MHGNSILLVSLTVAQEHEAEFNDFYHHAYIPKFLQVIPEFCTARRYVSTGDAQMRQYLSLYEFASPDVVDAGMAAMDRPGREAERSTFHDWETNHVQGVQSVVYSETYRHSREPADGAWGRRPMYLVTYQVRPEMEPAFSAWYESDYIPHLMADVPGYAACRRYASRGSDPQTYLTVYEIASLPEVDVALADMGAPWRTSQNRAWHHWEEAAVPVIAANVFRLIFSRPV
jgi:hypothetical protein